MQKCVQNFAHISYVYLENGSLWMLYCHDISEMLEYMDVNLGESVPSCTDMKYIKWVSHIFGRKYIT